MARPFYLLKTVPVIMEYLLWASVIYEEQIKGVSTSELKQTLLYVSVYNIPDIFIIYFVQQNQITQGHIYFKTIEKHLMSTSRKSKMFEKC